MFSGRLLLALALSWLLSAYFGLYKVIACWLVVEVGLVLRAYRLYTLAVYAHRSRKGRRVVVYDAEHEKDARAVEGEPRYEVIRDDSFDPWDLLKGSQSALLLVGRGSRVMTFLDGEAHTRRLFSRFNSYRDNMLESAESERRLAFQRLRFQSPNERVTQMLKGFGAEEVRAEFLADKSHDVEDAFGLIDWFFLGGVSTKARRRPSNLRLSHWSKLWHPRLRWEVLTPRWSYWTGLPDRLAASNPCTFSHVSMEMTTEGPPYACWRCEFGDESLLKGYSSSSSSSSFVVGKFRLVCVEELPCEWETEFVLGCKVENFVEISFVGVPFLYSVSNDKALSFLRSIRPGERVATGCCEWVQFCRASHLFLDEDSSFCSSPSPSDDSFKRLGFVRFGREAFVPFPQMVALQRYFVEMRRWLACYNSGGSSNYMRSHRGTRVAEGEDSSFRDEPVLRYLNIALTDFVQLKISREAMVNSAGHSAAVFIEHGQGFEAHTDSSPPFDVTLDLVVDHAGEDHRPLSLCVAGGDVLISCALGESVAFRGGEISHFGGDLPVGNTHTVALLTWTFCRD